MNQNTNKTHCIRGHEFTEENTYVKGSHRVCRECRVTVERAADAARRLRDKSDPERTKLLRKRRRKAQLKSIGWTTENFDKVFSEQQGMCAICSKQLAYDVRQAENRACADHCHVEPPVPRGLLCPQCNVGIGNLQDNPDLLNKAADYLRKHREEGLTISDTISRDSEPRH